MITKQITLILSMTILFNLLGCVNQNSQAKKQKFAWDFNSKNIYVYSFEQITNGVNNWGDDTRDADTSKIVGKGEVKIKSRGQDKADFVLTLTIEHNVFKSFNNMPPQTMIIPDMDANGQFESKRRNSDVMFDLIFPLPSKDLEIGESEKLDLEIPYNLMGSPLYIKGFNKLKYIKDTAPNTALIKSEFKVDQLDVPKEIKGEFMCSFVGKAEFEFNYKEKYFESSKVNLEAKMKSKFDMEKSMMGKMNMNMKTTNRYNIKFIKIEK